MRTALYFLVELDGRTRQVVNGVVTSLNKKTPIPAPIGTQDIQILWERSLIKWATVRNFSLPLGFPFDGALILRNDYYKINIDRILYLVIKRYVCETDPVYYRSYYKHLYKGEMDFSTFDDDKGESRVNMSISEGGISKLVKANENTQFNIPFDEDADNLLMDGILLTLKQNWITQAGLYAQDDLLGVIKTTNEGTAAGIATFDIFKQNEPGDLTTSLQYFLTTTQAIAGVNISGSVTFSSMISGPYTLRLKSSTGQNISLGVLADAGQLTFNQSFNGATDEKFFLVLDGASGLTSGNVRETTLNISLSSKYRATTIKFFRPIVLYKKLCAKLGIPEADAISTILENSTFCFTSGDAVRGLPDASIKTSLTDFLKANDVYLFTGTQIKDTIEVESRLNYFVSDTTDPAIELGAVKNLKVSPATDLMYSSIKIGHAEQNVDDVNGKYDFNGFHIYTTPIKRVDRQLDLQSPYKAGPYEIEITRINLEGKTTTGNGNDNDVFTIDVALNVLATQTILLSFIASGNYIVFPASPVVAPGMVFIITGSASNDRTYTVTSVVDMGTTQTVYTDQTITVSEPAVSVTMNTTSGQVFHLDRSVVPDSGVPDPATIFNVRLRVSEIAKAHYRWWRSWAHGYDADSFIFQSANRNSELVVAGVTDGRDIPIVSMGDRIFIPDYIEFSGISPISLQDTWDATPNKCFAFDWEDVRYTGFLWKSGLAPNSRQAQVFKMLSSIENNRLNLIA